MMFCMWIGSICSAAVRSLDVDCSSFYLVSLLLLVVVSLCILLKALWRFFCLMLLHYISCVYAGGITAFSNLNLCRVDM